MREFGWNIAFSQSKNSDLSHLVLPIHIWRAKTNLMKNVIEAQQRGSRPPTECLALARWHKSHQNKYSCSWISVHGLFVNIHCVHHDAATASKTIPLKKLHFIFHLLWPRSRYILVWPYKSPYQFYISISHIGETLTNHRARPVFDIYDKLKVSIYIHLFLFDCDLVSHLRGELLPFRKTLSFLRRPFYQI